MFAPAKESSTVSGSGVNNRTRKTTSQTVNNFHCYSRSQLPSSNLSNLQQVRKTVYSNIGPTAYQSNLYQRKQQHQRMTTSILQNTINQQNQQPDSATPNNQAVNLHISTGMTSTKNANSNGIKSKDDMQSSSLLSVPTSVLTHRHTASNAQSTTNSHAAGKQNDQNNDDSTTLTNTLISPANATAGLLQYHSNSFKNS